MISANEYYEIKKKVTDAGYADEVEWATSIKPVDNVDVFIGEYIWVVIHSGLAHRVARSIERKVWDAINTDLPLTYAFKHIPKCKAIAQVYNNKQEYFNKFIEAEDKLAYLESLPWIGKITKWHLAKNFGIETIKPDRHLVRIANNHGSDPFTLCNDIKSTTGEKLAVIDQVLWRAGELGLL